MRLSLCCLRRGLKLLELNRDLLGVVEDHVNRIGQTSLQDLIVDI